MSTAFGVFYIAYMATFYVLVMGFSVVAYILTGIGISIFLCKWIKIIIFVF